MTEPRADDIEHFLPDLITDEQKLRCPRCGELDTEPPGVGCGFHVMHKPRSQP